MAGKLRPPQTGEVHLAAGHFNTWDMFSMLDIAESSVILLFCLGMCQRSALKWQYVIIWAFWALLKKHYFFPKPPEF